MDYDVIISGCGPAGAAAAMMLGDMKTAVIERRDLSCDYSGGFVKCCGGLLAPDAQKALRRLNIVLPDDIFVAPQLRAVTTIDLKYGISRCYKRNYLNIDREKFDRYLAGLNHADKFYGRIITKAECGFDGTYTVTLDDGRTLTCRYLIGADGAASVVRRDLFPALRATRYVALQQSFVCAKGQDRYSAVFDSRLTDYSGWTFVKNGVTYVGGAFPCGKGAHAALDTMIDRLKKHGYIFGRPISRNGAIVMRPVGLPACPVNAAGTAALVGEAAGFISPTSAEGISWALNSGALCASSLLKGCLRSYSRRSLKLRLKLLIKQLKQPFMYCPPLRRAVMASGLLSVRHSE